MRRLVLWLVIGGVVALVGYSAVAASRAQRPSLPSAPAPQGPSPSPCRVPSYDLSPSGGAVQAVVVCTAGGRYQISVEASAEGRRASGQVTVRLLKDSPTAVSIPLAPPLPAGATTYSVRFQVRGV
ncbi:hypothetical protein HRbin23_01502 [bacterium HR23]|nr:hypothetical protein HRbin23_01502 [bacterium HR23]